MSSGMEKSCRLPSKYSFKLPLRFDQDWLAIVILHIVENHPAGIVILPKNRHKALFAGYELQFPDRRRHKFAYKVHTEFLSADQVDSKRIRGI